MEAIRPESGQPFEPRYHEAAVMCGSGEGGITVLEVMREGYIDRRTGLLIRPATVIAGRPDDYDR